MCPSDGSSPFPGKVALKWGCATVQQGAQLVPRYGVSHTKSCSIGHFWKI